MTNIETNTPPRERSLGRFLLSAIAILFAAVLGWFVFQMIMLPPATATAGQYLEHVKAGQWDVVRSFHRNDEQYQAARAAWEKLVNECGETRAFRVRSSSQVTGFWIVRDGIHGSHATVTYELDCANRQADVTLDLSARGIGWVVQNVKAQPK
jgi:hypothetical protein